MPVYSRLKGAIPPRGVPSRPPVNPRVNMKLQAVLTGGTKFDIYAIDLSDDPETEDCPAREFIDQLRLASNLASHKSLTATLNLHKDHGPIKNEQKSRPLGDGIFEFKTMQGDRIYYFYEPGGLTILTHGSPKRPSRQLVQEITRAQELRTRFREASAS